MNAECYKFPMLCCVAKRFGPRKIPPRLKVENSPDSGDIAIRLWQDPQQNLEALSI